MLFYTTTPASISFRITTSFCPIVVLEELDKFKKGNELINYQAREFVRTLDELIGDQFLTEENLLARIKGNCALKQENLFPKN
jgi:PhoH-like ATPase